MTRGRCGSLFLHRVTLSFTTPRRFNPAHGGSPMRIVASVALTLVLAWSGPAFAQPRPAGFPDVIGALKATPGCLGVETAHTPGGKRVIFAWFESKKALVDWYHGDVHQKAMKTAFPDLRFDRQPLPDLAEDSGPILAIVSVKLIDAPMPNTTAAIASI